MIDTHSHIYDETFDADREEALARAVEAGVRHIMSPAIDSESHAALFAMCNAHPELCLPMIGLHPTSVNDNPDWPHELALVEQYLASPPVERFYAIGEVGLDLHWSRDWLAEQTTVFERQVELALQYGLPLVIHTRDAWESMLTTLEKYAGTGISGVMHAFSGTIEDYRRIVEVGDFVFGVGGSVTYKNSQLAKLLPLIDPTHIVLETDAPWLTPVPFRGKRNESSYLVYIRDAVARILDLTPEQVDHLTTANARRTFHI
jgi:TatD DNase family protein